MKILSKRHPLRGAAPMDTTNWAHIHLVRPSYSALDYIDVPKLVNTIQSSCASVDETKITDYGNGDFTIEMWVKL